MKNKFFEQTQKATFIENVNVYRKAFAYWCKSSFSLHSYFKAIIVLILLYSVVWATQFKLGGEAKMLPYFTLNFTLRGVIDLRILHGGEAKIPSYLTPKPNVMETPNLACVVWCLPNFFGKIGFELIRSSLRRHGDIFRKMTSFLW